MQILKTENKRNSILPLFVVATFCLNSFILLILFFHGYLLQKLDKKLTPQSLVELLDGRSITANPQPNLERDPETIRRFVGEAITLMLTWSQQQPKADVLLAGSQLITDNSRQKFESEVDHLVSINQLENFNQSAENILVINRISQPVKIAEGKWKVEVTSNQLIFTNYDSLGKSSAFNKQIVVQAVDGQMVSLPDTPLPLNLAAYYIGEARLQISNVCKIGDKDCT